MGFFGSLWSGVKGIFSGGGEVVECFTTNAWHSQVRLFFGPGRFPMLTAWWWTTNWDNKKFQLRSWWMNLGCLQTIVYILAVVFLIVVFGGFIFFGADIILDVEDFGLLVSSLVDTVGELFNDAYDLIQIAFDWSAYFYELVFITLNPLSGMVLDLALALDFSPLPTYIIVGEVGIIILQILYLFVAPPAFKAAAKNKKYKKFYRILNKPLSLIQGAFGDILGFIGRDFIGLLFVPIRLLLLAIDIIMAQLF